MRRVAPTKRKPGAGPRGGGSTQLESGFVRTSLMFYPEELALLLRKASEEKRSASHVLRAAVRQHLGLPARVEGRGRGAALSYDENSQGPIPKTVYLLREELRALKRRGLEEERTASDVAREAVRGYCGE
jgi:hypothetical protein